MFVGMRGVSHSLVLPDNWKESNWIYKFNIQKKLWTLPFTDSEQGPWFHGIASQL